MPCWYSVFGKRYDFCFRSFFSLGIHPALCIHPIHEKNNLYSGSMLKSSSVCGARPSPHHRFYKEASQVHWTRSTSSSLDKAKAAAEWRWTIKFCLCCSPYYENTLAFFLTHNWLILRQCLSNNYRECDSQGQKYHFETLRNPFSLVTIKHVTCSVSVSWVLCKIGARKLAKGQVNCNLISSARM